VRRFLLVTDSIMEDHGRRQEDGTATGLGYLEGTMRAAVPALGRLPDSRPREVLDRMLTVTLRGLERDGLVTRMVHPTVPPRVDDTLTRMGRTLLDKRSTLLSRSLGGRPDATPGPDGPGDQRAQPRR
jgi:HxlR-like helix-turn-helix